MIATLAALSALVTFLIVLLAPPVSITYALNRSENLDGYFAVVGWFGLLRYRRTLDEASRERTPREKTAKKRVKKKGGRHQKTFYRLFRQSAFRDRLWQFVKDLMRALQARGLYLHAKVGLDGPYETGMLWAWIGTFSAMARGQSFADIDIAPDFVQPGLKFQSGGNIRFYPLQIIALSSRFLISPVSLRAWRAAARA